MNGFTKIDIKKRYTASKMVISESNSVSEMYEHLGRLKNAISNRKQKQTYLRCELKANIRRGRLCNEDVGYYTMLWHKWWKSNTDRCSSNPYFHLYRIHLALIREEADWGQPLHPIDIQNFILIDPFTLVQVANILTDREDFSVSYIYSSLYAQKPMYMCNTFHFGNFCLKYGHLILAKKLFKKVNLCEWKERDCLIEEIDHELEIVECANDICKSTGKDTKLKVCSSCGVTYYCSRKCQKQSWPVHKAICDNKWDECREILSVPRELRQKFPLHRMII